MNKVQEIDEELNLLSRRITTLQAIKFQILKKNNPSLLFYHKTATQSLIHKIILDSGKEGLTTPDIIHHLKVLDCEKTSTNVNEVIRTLKKKKFIKVKRGSKKYFSVYICDDKCKRRNW